jgi:hypothetical protein
MSGRREDLHQIASQKEVNKGVCVLVNIGAVWTAY